MPPPVDTAFYTPIAAPPEPYFLVVSALVPYKRLELAIEAVNRLSFPLKIVGEGTERPRLEALAGPTVQFLGRKTDEEVRELYRRAAAVLLPGEEDFGIVPVEAQACGRPVVALGRGGALETVIDGVTGVLVPEATVETWVAVLEPLTRQPSQFDPAAARGHAERFSREAFLTSFMAETRALLSAPASAVRW